MSIYTNGIGLIPGLRKYKTNTKDTIVPESEEVSKNDRDVSQEHRRHLKGVLAG